MSMLVLLCCVWAVRPRPATTGWQCLDARRQPFREKHKKVGTLVESKGKQVKYSLIWNYLVVSQQSGYVLFVRAIVNIANPPLRCL